MTGSSRTFVWVNYIVKVMLFFFMMSLPLSTIASNAFLVGAVALFWVSYPFVRREYPAPGRAEWKKLLLSPLPLYLLIIVSLAYSFDTYSTFKFLSKRISFLFVPLMFFAGFRLTRREFEAIISGIVPGVFMLLLYFLGMSVYGLCSGAVTWETFTVDNVAQFELPLRFHRTYLSAYILLALAAMFMSRYIRYQAWFRVVMLLLSCITIFFLESRIIIALLIGFLLLFPFAAYKGRKMWKAVAIMSAVVLVSLSAVYYAGVWDRVTGRFSEVSNEIDESALFPEIGYDSRASRWAVALDMIKERPLTGYGAGTEKVALNPAYEENGLHFSAQNNINIHNQYLSFAFENGVLAVAFYLLLLALMFVCAFRQRDFISCCLTFIIAVMGLSENILNVSWMVGLFGFAASAVIFGGDIGSAGKNKNKIQTDE